MKKFFSTREAANYLADLGTPFSPGTLEVWRCLKRGPSYKKIGHRVFYPQSALDDFVNGPEILTTDSV